MSENNQSMCSFQCVFKCDLIAGTLLKRNIWINKPTLLVYQSPYCPPGKQSYIFTTFHESSAWCYCDFSSTPQTHSWGHTSYQFIILSSHQHDTSDFSVNDDVEPVEANELLQIALYANNSELSFFKGAILTETKYDPAKSRMIPDEVQIPMWPMKGSSHLQNAPQNNKTPVRSCTVVCEWI